MKRLLHVIKIIAFITVCVPVQAQVNSIYNFDAGLGLSSISQASGSLEVITPTNNTFSDGSIGFNNTKVLHPLTVGSPNATGVADLTAFPASTDYIVTWKEYLTALPSSGGTHKKGVLMRATGTSSYATGLKQGYYFMVQNNSSGTVTFRILAATSSTLANLVNPSGTTITGFAVNRACWFRTSVIGNILKFEYSMDSITFTVGSTYTDASNLYPNGGTTQLVYGIGSGSGAYYYDNFNLLQLSYINITGSNAYYYNGSPQGPTAYTSSAGLTPIFAYTGTGSTSYSSSTTLPTAIGTYQAVATSGSISSSAFTFSILAKPAVIYDFTANTIGAAPSNISIPSPNTGSLAVNVSNASNAMRNNSTGSTSAGVASLDLFPSLIDYSVIWQELPGITGSKKAFVLRANGTPNGTTTSGVNNQFPGAKQGYLFFVQGGDISTQGQLRIYIYNGETALTNPKVTANIAYSPSLWYKATVLGSTLSLDYSTDGINFTTGISYVDASNTFPNAGTTQYIWGFSAPFNYLDNISYLSYTRQASTIKLSGGPDYLYNGNAQSLSAHVTGSTGAITNSFKGVGSTVYGPSTTAPSLIGTYQQIATLAADVDFFGAADTANFSIVTNPSIPLAVFRRPLSPSTPMYLIHADVWADQPQQVIDLIPVDLRPFVVINVSLSVSAVKNNGYNCADSWVNTCAQNGIWAMVQLSSGISNSFVSDTAYSLYESLYQRYPNFIGYNFAEQAWGFDAVTFPRRLNLFTKLLQMANKYGGYLYINDNFSVSNAGFNTISKFKTSQDFANATRVYQDNMIYGDKFTNSWAYYDNESGALGAFLSGHAGHYAVRYDEYSWPWSGRGQVFGVEAGLGLQNTDGVRSVFGCPEVPMGVPIIEHLLLQGATVIDGPEVPWMTTVYANTTASDTFPVFTNMLIDIYRKVVDGTIRIPERSEVVARTQLALINDVDNNTPDSLFSGLYAMDGTLKNNRTWFKKSGRYASIPQLALSGAYETSQFANIVKKSEFNSRWPNSQAKINEFNSLYPQISTGNLFVSRVNNSIYAYNPWINTDTISTGGVPLQYNTCDSVTMTFPAHTLSVINESANQLKIYLNNYRTDKNWLWTAYPNDLSWPALQSQVFPDYMANPRDNIFRNSVIKVYGAATLPFYTLTDRGKHQPSTATTDWTDGVFTITITHDGPVDLTINSAGNGTGKLTTPAVPAMVPSSNPSTYTGYKMYESEGAAITSPASIASTAPYFYGTSYVKFSNASAGSAVTFNVINVQSAGSYQLQSRYTASQGNVSSIDLYVNGIKVASPTFTGTATDSAWTINNQNINLNAGSNTIQFKANASAAFYLDDITINAQQQVLPVTMLVFNALKIENKAQLTWSTATEINSKEFIIQRSIDGVHFNTIGSLPAAGNSTTLKNYIYNDDIAMLVNAYKRIYYRLQEIDLDGSGYYSKVASIEMSNSVEKFFLLGNPVQSEAQIGFSSNGNRQLRLKVLDANGKTVIQKQWDVVAGYNKLQLNTSLLSKGQYIIQATDAHSNFIVKMLKQ